MHNSVWKASALLQGSWRGATSVLLTQGQHHIIVDTGMPHEAHQIVTALELRGIRPTDIQTVINTHFHFDHVLNNTLFPGSQIYGTQESYDWCRALYSDLMDQQNWETLVLKYYPETFEYERARGLMAKLRALALRWWDPKRLGDSSQFRWIETHPLPAGLEGLATSGHVPGHASVIVDGGEQHTVIAGDALLSRQHDEQVLTMIPHHRIQFHRDRERILAMQARILPGHDLEFSTTPSEPSQTDVPAQPVPSAHSRE